MNVARRYTGSRLLHTASIPTLSPPLPPLTPPHLSFIHILNSFREWPFNFQHGYSSIVWQFDGNRDQACSPPQQQDSRAREETHNRLSYHKRELDTTCQLVECHAHHRHPSHRLRCSFLDAFPMEDTPVGCGLLLLDGSGYHSWYNAFPVSRSD